jgi:cold-inducible RNA-binding protein
MMEVPTGEGRRALQAAVDFGTGCFFTLTAGASPREHGKGILVKKLYVGNLSFSVTESELREMFAPFGAVATASLVTERDTGRSRGFGFVEMTNDTEAAAAIAALNGKDSGGRPLTVNEARPKKGGGGGRY